MKKIYMIFLLISSCLLAKAYNVTFRVDMQGQTGFPAPEVIGTFNNWCFYCNPMTDSNGDGIFETTINLPAGNYEYKFAYGFIIGNYYAGQEVLTPGSSCTTTNSGLTNRHLYVSGNSVLPVVCWGSCTTCSATTYNVTFKLDMQNVSGFTTPEIVVTFNMCAGCIPMTDLNGDNIWEVTIPLMPGSYEYKFIYDSWDFGQENLTPGSSCTTTNSGYTWRFITVSSDVILPVVCWESCQTCAQSLGCTAPNACNFNPTATINDGTCNFGGCLNSLACNYDPTSLCENESCIFPGCINPNACNFNPDAGCDDGTCILPGCNDNNACNFSPLAGCNDGSCTYPGCTNPNACNFNSLAGCDNGSCVFPGCTDNNACNFSPLAGCNDGSCTSPGCTNSLAYNYNPIAACDDGSCSFSVTFKVDMTYASGFTIPEVNGTFNGWCGGCAPMSDSNGDNIWEVTIPLMPGSYEFKYAYDAWAGSEALAEGSTCTVTTNGYTNRYLSVSGDVVLPIVCWGWCQSCSDLLGCTDPIACNYETTAAINDGSCNYGGCLNALACNYDPTSMCDNGSCVFPGCNNPNACNFNPLAGCDNGSCILPGCTDNAACNYNPVTTCDNGSCTYPGCTNPIACNFNPSAGCDNGTCIFPGCTEINACNYNSLAGCNDGSCTYAGCTNSLACNFNPAAGCDNGSCHFTNEICSDNNANTILDAYNSNCNCVGIPYSYGSLASSSNTICPEVTDYSVSINNAPSGIVDYTLQWYYKTGNNAAPTGSSNLGWNIIAGETSSTLGITPFTGTRTYACFVTPSSSYGIANRWMTGAKVLTYSSFAAQTIIGNPNVIPFVAYNYLVNPASGHTFNWIVINGAIASGQGTNVTSIIWGQNGPYQVTLTESDGTCSGTSVLFAVNNNCSISVSAASSTTNSFCAGTTLQLQAATSANGITYQWYLNGTLIPNETNQNISVSSGGNYQVSINQNGCTAISNIVTINQLPNAIIPNIIVDQANAGCAGGDAILTVSGGAYTNLLWNNGLTTSTISVSTSGDFSITAIDENGCAVSAGPVSVNFSILDPVPVCIVTVDQVTGKNNVVWEPVTSDLINSYVVLKETNVANEYAQIGTVAYGSNGIFEDVNSDPQIQANRYKLALIDTCGILSSTSNFHKTIHLTANQGLGSNVNLIWSNYEGFDFGSYSIYRGLSSSSLNLITTIASNLNSFTVVNPPAGEAYYMIEVAGVSCDPERTLVYSRSNILDASGIGIKEYDSSKIFLYPNPATTSINLQVNMSLIGEEYVVFDAIGKVIYTNKIQSINEFIQLEYFNNGNYFIKVNEVVKRFEVIK